MIRAKQHRHKHIPISLEVWNLLSALKTYAKLWRDYIEDWPVQHVIRETPLFEECGLIEIKRSVEEFSYSKTESGKEFFEQFGRIKVLIVNDEIGEWEDRCEAAEIVQRACSWNNVTAPSGSWDRMILTSLNIHRAGDLQLTSFGQCLRSVATQILISYPSEWEPC